MSDDDTKDNEPYRTPIEREALRVMRGRIHGAQRIRIAHYTAHAARIIKECQAFRATIKEGEEDLLATVEEDEKICDAFLELVLRNEAFEDDNSLALNLVEVGIQAMVDRFGHTILPTSSDYSDFSK